MAKVMAIIGMAVKSKKAPITYPSNMPMFSVNTCVDVKNPRILKSLSIDGGMLYWSKTIVNLIHQLTGRLKSRIKPKVQLRIHRLHWKTHQLTWPRTDNTGFEQTKPAATTTTNVHMLNGAGHLKLNSTIRCQHSLPMEMRSLSEATSVHIGL